VRLAGPGRSSFSKAAPPCPPAPHRPARILDRARRRRRERFAGTARYRLEFDAPATPAADWLLDFGDVRESARVRLNGADAGTAWSLPLRLRLGPHLRPGRNVLELDVTNLAANRIRDLDIRKERWKIMREINFVNINYKPFDASGWPLTPSGLLGPVTLTPLREMSQ
jgi:hypothetical protein